MKPVALITGASAGLGAEFARQLSRKGHRLVLAARRKDRLDALAAELGNARTVEIDLGKSGAAAALVRDVQAAGEQVDLLINNAGFGLRGRFVELDAAREREMIDLNCGALTDLCRAVAPQMIERRSGGILNVASTAAFQPGPKMAVYFATKAFVLSFTEALHEELKPHGVKVSALCPGPTRTEFGEVAGIGTLGQFERLSMDAEPVVRAGIEGLERNRAVVIPGAINKAGAWSTRFAPRSIVRKIAGSLKF
ncbi:SDR family oxidoreductase [Sphingomonas sp. SM33]|uniref:SDR family oxidoreductase n=1 Tax=Sphingomonas telluris TaxID=2907998 RepID=A0ABS9VPP3_9SPHN|nr:SDR family oxidoreductase [Sphingomonas telluris]MCH8616930.1 SDR family oxidoreductase [Sphingomonas telluris]